MSSFLNHGEGGGGDGIGISDELVVWPERVAGVYGWRGVRMAGV